MKVLIVAAGSHGDVLPFIAIAAELIRRGHAVRLYTGAAFESLVRCAGIDFVALDTREDFLAVLRNPDTNHPIRSLQVMARYADRYARAAHDAVAASIEPGQTILVGSSLAFTTRVIAEMHDVPVVTVHLSPSLFRSVHQRPRVGSRRPITMLPAPLQRFFWWLADRLVIDRTLGAALNRHRADLGLPPIRRAFDQWIHAADGVVGMFPEWFAARPPDWPAKLRLTGFPLYDQGNHRPLPEALESFLDLGPPPVGFTAGTANAAARDFFAESVEACRRSGRRAILVTEHADLVPSPLPSGMVRVGYVPFSRLLPRLAAFVHHGGIGTTSQALAAGVPQLIRPLAHDQFDNAERAVRLGVALEIRRKAYTAATIKAALDRIEADPAIAAACRTVAGRLRGDSVAETCDVVLDVGRSRLGVARQHV